jgi:hypothetical protein
VRPRPRVSADAHPRPRGHMPTSVRTRWRRRFNKKENYEGEGKWEEEGVRE